MQIPESPTRKSDGDPETAEGYDRRQFLTLGTGLGAAMLAGCATSADSTALGSDGTSTDAQTASTATTGEFRLFISDQPTAIGEFDRLDVSLDRARVFPAGQDEEESADDEQTESIAETESGTETEDAADEREEDRGEAGEEAGDQNERDEEESDDDDEEDGEEDQGEQGEEDDADEDQEAEEETVEEEEDRDDQDAEEEADEEEGEEEQEATEDEEEDGEQEQGDGEGADDQERGFFEVELENVTVDLTEVVGDKAVRVFDGELPTGRYAKIELEVSGVEGVVEGNQVTVKVPSEKLQIVKPFEVVAQEPLEFVFDITVVKKGQTGEYNLLPVISESGIAGKDVPVEEVDRGPGEEQTGQDAGNQSSNDSSDDAGDDT